jgi:hypothetical protein
MAIFPADDLTLPLATRKRLRPLVESWRSEAKENVLRNPPTRGNAQALDLWGTKKWWGSGDFNLFTPDVELIHSFWEVYGNSFTIFDFANKQFGAPGYRPRLSIGTANGTATWTLAGKEAVAGYTIYVNNVAKTLGVDYTYSEETGAQGEAQIIFTAGHIPAGGAGAIEFAGLLRCRYTAEIREEPTKRFVDWNRQLLSLTAWEKW